MNCMHWNIWIIFFTSLIFFHHISLAKRNQTAVLFTFRMITMIWPCRCQRKKKWGMRKKILSIALIMKTTEIEFNERWYWWWYSMNALKCETDIAPFLIFILWHQKFSWAQDETSMFIVLIVLEGNWNSVDDKHENYLLTKFVLC